MNRTGRGGPETHTRRSRYGQERKYPSLVARPSLPTTGPLLHSTRDDEGRGDPTHGQWTDTCDTRDASTTLSHSLTVCDNRSKRRIAFSV